MSLNAEASDGPDPAADPNSYARAILNILEDSGAERLRLEAAQKATLNILADFSKEKARLADVQKAILNILEDLDAEKHKVEQTNREMAREIAERKQAEEALRRAKAAADAANRELEAFSYSVAHDLRAPLRSIDGFSQALIEDFSGKLGEDGERNLQRVRAGAQRMAQLIDDLLKLSRISRAELTPERVDLSALARAVLRELQDREPGRSVSAQIQGGLVAEGDPHLLRILIENLLGNAWKFTGKKARARIELGATVQDGRTVYFIRDDGAGFDMAYAAKLFAPFQRLHSQGEFEGTGIGLATVQRIIHRHHGRVWAEGEVDRGATFHFALEEGA